MIALLTLLLSAWSSCDKETPVQKTSPLPYESNAYIIQLSTATPPSLPANFADLSRFHFYGITWNGNVEDNLRFAKQMGYSYIMYRQGMENSAQAKDLCFYLESPEYQVYYTLGVDRKISPEKTYTDIQKENYQKYFALKITSAEFPANMAEGWHTADGFTVEPDWQQVAVREYFIKSLKEYIRSKEKPANNFLFAGLTWDVPQFAGDFWGGGKQITLAYWNGKDSSALYPGRTHEYATYSQGKVNYYLALKDSVKAAWSSRRLLFVYEPYDYYKSWFKDMETLDNATQTRLLQDALITQEAGVKSWSTGTEFVDDTRPYSSGLFDKQHAGSSTPDNKDLPGNTVIAGKAAVNGAWFNWYGRFSGSTDTMKNIYQVPNWLQLIRVAGNWDNLNGVPLSQRNWNGTAYSSTNSRIDQNIIYSRQPKTQKLFVVFLNNTGKVLLKPGEKIVSVKRVDRFFCETINGIDDLIIEGNTLRIK